MRGVCNPGPGISDDVAEVTRTHAAATGLDAPLAAREGTNGGVERQ